MPEKRILEFYGQECSHCMSMKSLVKRAEDELGMKCESFEIWHNKENANRMDQYDKGYCGGVPFFYNLATHKWICGEVPYEEFKSFAQEE